MSLPEKQETTKPEHGDQAVNASGHVQELNRNFSRLSLIGVGLVCGSVWPAAGGSIVVALYNGGPPGKHPRWKHETVLTIARRPVRVHSSICLLLDRSSMHSRACVCHSLLCWSVSLGDYHSRPEMGTHSGLLCWILELACLGIRHCQLSTDLCKTSLFSLP